MTPRLRKTSLAVLSDAGFSVAPGLPVLRRGKLRSRVAIAARLMALDAVFTWASEGGQRTPTVKVRAYAERSGLDRAMTPAERCIWGTPRKRACVTHGGAIGWKLEAMWPLSWALGFAPPPDLAGLIRDEVVSALYRFLPPIESTSKEFAAASTLRPVVEVRALEDLFYGAHNAVRSALLGGATVPRGFHPVSDGGAIAERRHALSWLLTPTVAWDDTDLST
jgi:hypothetical protein